MLRSSGPPVTSGDLLTALAEVVRWRPWRAGPAAAWRSARAPLLANAVLAGALVATGGWSLYLLTGILPCATWYRVVTRVRDIAEHGMVPAAEDPLRSARSIGAGPAARALVAHHLLVFVPCWKLGRVHSMLLAEGYGGRMERARSDVEVLSRAAGPRGAG